MNNISELWILKGTTCYWLKRSFTKLMRLRTESILRENLFLNCTRQSLSLKNVWPSFQEDTQIEPISIPSSVLFLLNPVKICGREDSWISLIRIKVNHITNWYVLFPSRKEWHWTISNQMLDNIGESKNTTIKLFKTVSYREEQTCILTIHVSYTLQVAWKTNGNESNL
jgi:hypothetical protein